MRALLAGSRRPAAPDRPVALAVRRPVDVPGAGHLGEDAHGVERAGGGSCSSCSRRPGLIAPAFGLAVDRMRKRPLMIATDVAIGLVLLTPALRARPRRRLDHLRRHRCSTAPPATVLVGAVGAPHAAAAAGAPGRRERGAADGQRGLAPDRAADRRRTLRRGRRGGGRDPRRGHVRGCRRSACRRCGCARQRPAAPEHHILGAGRRGRPSTSRAPPGCAGSCRSPASRCSSSASSRPRSSPCCSTACTGRRASWACSASPRESARSRAV